MPGRWRLGAEFALLFLAGPLILAFALPAVWIWPALGIISLIGIALLAFTPAFRWQSLFDWRGLPSLKFFLVWALALFAAMVILTVWLRPYSLFQLPRNQPDTWLSIMILYPFVSALPQELVYRALFFTRYRTLFPSGPVLVIANASCFSLAHLFYGNWPAVILSAFGGLLFAWIYHTRNSFLAAWLLHAWAGQVLFTCGLGILFYSGAVPS